MFAGPLDCIHRLKNPFYPGYLGPVLTLFGDGLVPDCNVDFAKHFTGAGSGESRSLETMHSGALVKGTNDLVCFPRVAFRAAIALPPHREVVCQAISRTQELTPPIKALPEVPISNLFLRRLVEEYVSNAPWITYLFLLIPSLPGFAYLTSATSSTPPMAIG